MNIGPLIERPDSPQINGTGPDKTITRMYNVDKSVDYEQYVPSKGAVSPEGDGFFLTPSFKTKPGYNIIAFTYGGSLVSPSNKDRARRSGSIDYDFRINIIEKALETHADYLVCWNYDLYGWSTDTTPPSVPAWAATATTRTNATGLAAAAGFYWSKSRPSDPKAGYWHKIKDCIEPGVEAYPVPQPVIITRKYFKNEDLAVAYMPSTISLGAPGKTYGWSSNDSHWLQFPQGIPNDGEFFVAEIEHEYADSWSSNLYS